LLPGKYDTQTSLYDALGISEQEVSNTWNGSFTSPNLAYEEEIVAYAYKDVTAVTAFQLGFASRRVALLALKHAPVQVISINGIDPVEEPQAIYNGTYPLSRKIHLLTTDNASQNINDFVDYMLSPWGQAVIESAGYLPLAQNESIR
jgi:ABC-type phosphate transport system substrate-binding protein